MASTSPWKKNLFLEFTGGSKMGWQRVSFSDIYMKLIHYLFKVNILSNL